MTVIKSPLLANLFISCVDFDECRDFPEPPCQHAANCINVYGDYYCECMDGWTGKDCDTGKNCYSTMISIWVGSWQNVRALRFKIYKHISKVYKVNNMRHNYYKNYYIHAFKNKETKRKKWEHTIRQFYFLHPKSMPLPHGDAHSLE